MHAVRRRTVRATQLAAVLLACSTSIISPFARQLAVPRPVPPPQVVWWVTGEGHGRPVVDRDTVYFLSSRHEVVAVAPDTGAVRWRHATGEPGDTTAGSALTVAGSTVIAGDYNLVGFDRTTGAVRWRFTAPLGYGPGIYLGEVSGTTVLAGSPAGRLYAVYATTGELRWSAEIVRQLPTTVFQPATDGTVVAAGYTTFTAPPVGGVVLLDFATGRELWRARFPTAPDPLLGTGYGSGLLLTRSAIVASSGDGSVYGFSRADGSQLWVLPPLAVPPPFSSPFPVPPGPGADYRPLARSGGLLIVGSLKGRVTAFDAITRRERWTHAVAGGGSVAFALTADDEAVYVPLASGRHLALDASTGRERWRTADPRDDFLWPAFLAGNHVYLAGGRGGFIAVRR